MPYIANTGDSTRTMFETVGVGSFEELWRAAGVDFPAPEFSFPEGKSEYEVTSRLKQLAEKNAVGLVNFLGGGFYDHVIPAAVGEITGRSEFYTAYTPYQPEASQGTLQAIYEYQSMICRLTGMAVSNASLYDGGTALFESMMLCCRVTKKRRAVISEMVSPIYRRMIRTYCANLDVELCEVPGAGPDSDRDDYDALVAAVDENTACVLVQNPNFMGRVADWTEFNRAIHGKKAMSVLSAYPMSLALVKTPGEMDFDVVCGEGQCFGMSLSFGGPYLGYLALKRDFMRKMPGRVVGRTVDGRGNEGFVLTMQAREQHIRRESAMSNICSNENLCALSALAYLSCVGAGGLVQVAESCAGNAVFTRNEMLRIKGVRPVGGDSFFNEFVLELPMDAGEVAGRLIDRGIAGGFPLGRYYKGRENQLLVALTEKRTLEEMRHFVNVMEAVLWN